MKKSLLILITLCLSIGVLAQDGTLDTTFNASDVGFGYGDGANNYINNTVIQNDGKIIISGAFTEYNGTSSNKIARLNTDGSLDTSFNVGTGVNSTINLLVLQDDGKIIIGGDFTTFNGIETNNLARLNSDGSLDASFNTGSGTDGSVTKMVLQDNGKILIIGSFISYDGVSIKRLARLNTDGSLDTSFNIGGSGTDNDITSITIQNDGKILIGGNFSTYNSITSKKLARLNTDGSLDTSLNTDLSVDSTSIYDIVQQDDGQIIIIGDFLNRINRLNIDGSIDNTFNNTSSIDNTFQFKKVLIQDDGKIIIIVKGLFWPYGKNITRLESNGDIDNTFLVNYSSLEDDILDFVIKDNGQIIVVGDFVYYAGNVVNNIVLLNSDGNENTSFNLGTGFDSTVSKILVQDDGKIISNGAFTSYNGINVKDIVRLNTDGSIDTSFSVPEVFDVFAEDIVIQNDGKIILVGFYSPSGSTYGKIVRLNSDSSLDTSFNIGTGTNNRISALAIQEDGKIVVGGLFSSFNNEDVSGIIRLNNDGSLDTSFNSTNTNVSGNIITLAIQEDGKILIGGSILFYDDVYINGIARINTDGSLDTSFNVDIDVYYPKKIIIQNDGKIIIGGSFNGTDANGIVRLNIDGSLDTTFNTGTGFNHDINTIVIQDDDKIVLGGSFTNYNGIDINHLARLNTDGSLNTNFNMGFGANNKTILAIARQDDGKILIGGDFTSYNNIGRNRIARINASALLSIEENGIISSKILAYQQENILLIKNTTGTMQSVYIFDITGKHLYKNNQVNNTEIQIPNLNTKNQLLIIKVIDSENVVTTKKIVIE